MLNQYPVLDIKNCLLSIFIWTVFLRTLIEGTSVNGIPETKLTEQGKDLLSSETNAEFDETTNYLGKGSPLRIKRYIDANTYAFLSEILNSIEHLKTHLDEKLERLEKRMKSQEESFQALENSVYEFNNKTTLFLNTMMSRLDSKYENSLEITNADLQFDLKIPKSSSSEEPGAQTLQIENSICEIFNAPAQFSNGDKTNSSAVTRNSGRYESVVEEGKEFDVQYGGCGGILVAEKGLLLYTFTPETNTSVKCVWTIRANECLKISFRLVADNLGNPENSHLTLTPFEYLESYGNPVETYSTTFNIAPGDRTERIVSSPIAFITFHYQSSIIDTAKSHPVGFKLSFEGKVPSHYANRNLMFSHYHRMEHEGYVKYPEEWGKYKDNEIVTFVINPTPAPIPMHINLLSLSIEAFMDRCEKDNLVFLSEQNDKNSITSFIKTGPKLTDYRYCGQNGIVNESILPVHPTSHFIVIFKSDNFGNYPGFQFTWKKNE